MKIALVTSWGNRCGIAEHSAMLVEHVRAANHDIEYHIDPTWLDPLAGPEPYGWDVIHLNYHRGLHSRWTPEVIREKVPPATAVVITFHDTYEQQPDLLPWDLLALDCVKAMVVHEPCDLSGAVDLDDHHLASSAAPDLIKKVHYWRQACPERTGASAEPPFQCQWAGDYGWRPTLGTLGFDFPWKNYDRLARVTGKLGWNLRIVGDVPDQRVYELRQLNPRIHFDGYAPTHTAVAALERCDATAFLYDCANSGTSAAIRLGIAAGRPLIATKGCRQFRDLEALEEPGILWAQATDADFTEALTAIGGCGTVRGYDLDIVQLAHRERWPLLGAKYAALYEEALRG